jgi:hypothetical protein
MPVTNLIFVRQRREVGQDGEHLADRAVAGVGRIGDPAVPLGDDADHMVQKAHVVHAKRLGGLHVLHERLDGRTEPRELIDAGSDCSPEPSDRSFSRGSDANEHWAAVKN